MIRLTSCGRGLLASVAAPVSELKAQMISKLSPARAADFRRTLTTAWQSLT